MWINDKAPRFQQKTLRFASIGLLLGGGLVGLGGCGSKMSHAANSMSMMNSSAQNMNAPMAKVTMTIPKDTYVGTPNTFSVKVTQSGKPVEAEDVKFEIWENKAGSSHQVISAKSSGDGEYSIDYSFKSAGAYNVMYHVVANSMMIMTGPQLITVMK
jgi:YtkA-like